MELTTRVQTADEEMDLAAQLSNSPNLTEMGVHDSRVTWDTRCFKDSLQSKPTTPPLVCRSFDTVLIDSMVVLE